MIRYLKLTKPNIIFGNLVTAFGAFVLASHQHIDWKLLFFTLFGLACVIGSACVFNNYIDRSCDSKMKRTQKRPLASKQISEVKALIFGSLLLITGIFLLMLHSGLLSALLAACGFILYVFAYSLLKYYTPHATLVGSISGAIPAVVGYLAMNKQFDGLAWLLFGVMVLWQMPHFFAIALYRIEDYRAAGIPVLPIAKGLARTKLNIILYTLAFVATAPLLPLAAHKGFLSFSVALLLSLSWAFLAFKKMEGNWARKMFAHSLIVIMGLFASLSIL